VISACDLMTPDRSLRTLHGPHAPPTEAAAFSPTQPGAATPPPTPAPSPETTDVARVGDFFRRLRSTALTGPDEPSDSDYAASTHSGATQLLSLNDSLLQDLQRFEPSGPKGLDLLEVLAASLRHGNALRVHLRHGFRVLPIKVYPAQRQVHSTLPMVELLALPLHDLRVQQVQPEHLDAGTSVGRHSPLAPLLWELALRGARDTLLPEIAGSVAYRVSGGADFTGLVLAGTLAQAVHRLKREPTTLRDLAQWPGFDANRAARMLNGLYLQGALIVSRTAPAATHRD
jgi:hypothetical protein